MRRKSERNKPKGSPEKKAERATRKSTRKRGKRAMSSSPEREETEEKTADISKAKEEMHKETKSQQSTVRPKQKELKTVIEEEIETTKSVGVTELAATEGKSQEGEEASIVWKVARADASPGEIQKLKLCRQRNPSEASDSSSSRKKLHKWYESGEGDGEEVDSAEEHPTSLENEAVSVQPDDTPSPIPGQDSKEEVSDNKEILSKTTSADLSDDKPNVDQLDTANEACGSEIADHTEKLAESNHGYAEANSNGDHFKNTTDNTEIPAESETPKDVVEKDAVEDEDKLSSPATETSVATDAKNEKTVTEQVQVTNSETEKPNTESEVKVENQSPESTSEKDNETNLSPKKSDSRIQPRSIRRKHRTKYDTSDSETPDSEEETSPKPENDNVKTTMPPEVVVDGSEEPKEEKNATALSSTENRLHLGEVADKERFQTPDSGSKDSKKSTNGADDEKVREVSPVISQSSNYKPAKVNLKRSFSSRVTETDEIKKEDTEKNSDGATSPRDKVSRVSTDEIDKNIPRKRRWGTTTTIEATSPTFAVSTDSLKVLVPEAKPLSVAEVRLSKDDDSENERRREREDCLSVSDDAVDQNSSEHDVSKTEASKKTATKHENHIGAKRKISILKEPPIIKSPTPPSSNPTNVLLIKNLVRPFTLNQIKELLSRTGTIAENGFWIDGIKSKCYVVYANEDQAFETRQALHGISWPLSNPKRLHVEYASLEDMQQAKEQAKDQPVQRKTDPLAANDGWQQAWAREEKPNAGAKTAAVREWDLGKEDGHQIKDKEREKKDLEKKRRQRSRSPPLEAHLPPPARKFKKKEDEPPPAKLLDDLFKKTKAIPCIYWLPLTNEQIVVKEEMRRQHMAEHARRLEEMRRAERNRETAARRHRSPKK